MTYVCRVGNLLLTSSRQVRMGPMRARIVVLTLAILGTAACTGDPAQLTEPPALRMDQIGEPVGSDSTWTGPVNMDSPASDTSALRDGGHYGGSGN